MLKVYTDTSVIGGCFDAEFQEWSIALFDEFKNGTKRFIYSDLVIKEVTRAPITVLEKIKEVPEEFTLQLPITETAMGLAETYINEGALSSKCFEDALHIALATLNNADVLASWNFKHIVNLDRIRLYNEINKKLGLSIIEIRTPREILKTLIHERG